MRLEKDCLQTGPGAANALKKIQSGFAISNCPLFILLTVLLLICALPDPAGAITANQATPARTNLTPVAITVTGSGATASGMVQLVVNGTDIPMATPTASAAGDYAVSGSSALIAEPAVNAIQVRDITTGSVASAGNVILDITAPTLTTFSGSPDPADAGTINLTFKFSEAMQTDSIPTVKFTTSGGLQVKEATRNPVWSADALTYSVAGTVNLTDAEGLATVAISNAFDLAGNQYENTSAGTFTIDLDLTPASIYPASPFFSNDLQASPNATGNTFTWYKNDLPIPGQTNYILSSAFTSLSDSIRVDVTLSSGDIKASAPITIISSLPTNFAATSSSNGVITLSWTPSLNPDVTKVLIYSDRGTGVMDLASPLAEVAVPQSTYTLTGLTDGKSYSFLLGVAAASGQSEVTSATAVQSAASALSDKSAPLIKALSPDKETSISTPRVVFSISDATSGVDLSSILLTLDGVAVPHAFSSTEGLVYYPVPLALSAGDHSAALKIADKVGNSASLIHFFRVSAAREVLNCNIYPNPCRNLRQTIRYTLSSGAQDGTITIYDARERVVRRFEDAPNFSGINEVEWDLLSDDGLTLPNGTYFIELKFRFLEGVTSKKMLKSSLIR